MNYLIRKLTIADLAKESFFATLSNLRPVENLSLNQAQNIFEDCDKKGVETYVAEENGKIVGTVRLVFESKFYHSGKIAAHIEDVATHRDHVGRGVASALIKELVKVCRDKGCYKIILDCSDELTEFYKKFGFSVSGNCCRLDL